MSSLLITVIKFYQRYLSFDRGLLMFLTPGGACKYNPTCSQYMIEQIRKKGVTKGVLRGIRRIISCR